MQTGSQPQDRDGDVKIRMVGDQHGGARQGPCLSLGSKLVGEPDQHSGALLASQTADLTSQCTSLHKQIGLTP